MIDLEAAGNIVVIVGALTVIVQISRGRTALAAAALVMTLMGGVLIQIAEA